MVIAHDDMDLPVGKVRLRGKGGSGGHNGIKSVIAHVKSEDFARFRIGIGHPIREGNEVVINHVLTPFAAEDAEKIADAIKYLVPAAECFLTDGIDAAMNRYNPRKQKGE